MKFLRISIVLVFFTQFIFASDMDKVKEIFMSKIDEVVQIVDTYKNDIEIRNAKIVKTVDPMFDFELMAKLSLGKRWFTLDPIERAEFVKLYVNRMKKSYSSKLDSYSGETIEITDISQPKPTRILLESNLHSNETKFQVSYKFYKPKMKKENKLPWLIYDVEILGVSILKTDRAQFSEYLQKHTITELKKQLAK